MTKKMTIHTIPVPRTKGFTLIEMLVVAALIAIFAGLAVFNIVEQLQREKEKAALAEARSIATAMSFANDDLGFFPKLCFLKFGLDEMLKAVADYSLPDAAIDYMGQANSGMLTKIQTKWGEKYMGGSMPEKYVKMSFPGSPAEGLDWPADPFKQPYVAYLVKIETTSPPPGLVQRISFLENLGESANYFAGIVSYGRNKVPGLKWDDAQAMTKPNAAGRLYVPDPADPRHFTIPANHYTLGRLNLLTQEGTADDPNIRDVGSDDKYFEF